MTVNQEGGEDDMRKKRKPTDETILLEQKILYYKAELEKYKRKVERYRKNYTVQEFEKAQEKNNELTAYLKELQEEFAKEINALTEMNLQLIGENNQLKANHEQLAAHVKEYEQLSLEITNLKQQLVSENAAVEEWKGKSKELHSELQSAEHDHQQEISRLKEEITQAVSINKELKQELAKEKKEQQKKVRRNRKLRSELKKTIKELKEKTTQYNKITSTQEAFQSETEELKRINQELETDIQNARSLLQEQIKEKQKMADKLSQTTKTLENTKEEKDESSGMIQALQHELEALKTKLLQAESDNHKLIQKHDAGPPHASKKMEELLEVNKKLKQTNESLVRALEESNTLEDEQKIYQQQLARLESHNQELMMKVEEVEKELHSLSTNHTSRNDDNGFEKQIKELSNLASKYESKLTMNLSIIYSMEEEIRLLTKEIHYLKAQMLKGQNG
ncbi:hypothetical protein A6P54_11290 [Bacillus sp. MKU004]|nr:hypothetical protein A6P54_11290 [Bacillus sp. MKU004]QTC41799.1 hypothetical protein I7V34_00500 [Bacillus sp. V3]